MGVLRRALLLAVMGGAVGLTGGRNGPIAVAPRGGGALSPQGIYTPQSKEFYLSTEDFTYIRPGFNITINSVTIPSDNKPIVDFDFTDDLKQPLDRNGAVTPGALSVSFVIAWRSGYARLHLLHHDRGDRRASEHDGRQQGNPGDGRFRRDVDGLAVGHSTYKFGKALPAGYDRPRPRRSASTRPAT